MTPPTKREIERRIEALESVRSIQADDDADPGPNIPELTDEEKEILDEAFDVEVPTQIEP